MALPETPSVIERSQLEFYKSANKLAKLWYALTIVGLILWIICIILSFVGTILAVTYYMPNINSMFFSPLN